MPKLVVVCLIFVAGVAVGARAASQAPKLFAVELTRGPSWDTSKSAGEQPGFSEHSANIKRLTDTQALVIGARYGDKGLLIITAADEAAARAHFALDPMVARNVFRAEVAAFSAFKHGCTNQSK
jgi:uncharacterized protein YciI